MACTAKKWGQHQLAFRREAGWLGNAREGAHLAFQLPHIRDGGRKIENRPRAGVCPQAASSSTCTRRPRAVAMFTRASSENRETRPRSRSLMRGWVTPQRAAASVCFQSLALMRAAICRTRSARARRLAACSGVSAIACHTLSKDSIRSLGASQASGVSGLGKLGVAFGRGLCFSGTRAAHGPHRPAWPCRSRGRCAHGSSGISGRGEIVPNTAWARGWAACPIRRVRAGPCRQSRSMQRHLPSRLTGWRSRRGRGRAW